jgi:AcrR family transcriptional regulator
MARPVSIPDEVILETARHLFLERGSDVPTSEIAARAGVSHGIIFKRFKTKRALFNAAMNVATDWEKALPARLSANIGKKAVETPLIEVGNIFVEKFLVLIPTLMMSWSTRPGSLTQERLEMRNNRNRAAHSLQAVKAITKYLEAEHKLGRIGKADFDVVAQAFVGALWYHSFLQVTLGGKRQANHRLYVTRLVRLLLSGIGTGGRYR